MADFTRRTHIVRISDAPEGEPPSDTYVDVEVLDAVAFKGPGGEDMVMSFKPENIDPVIIDNTGGGHGKTTNTGTRRSHMERITSASGGLIDVEVLDIVAFRTKNGEQWILNFPSKKASSFSTNGESDPGNPTRRTHKEKISDGFKKDPAKGEYMTVVRTDAVAFRTIFGKELIIKMPSNDDPNSRDGRAKTFISSPKGYDPTNENGPVPPPNKDKNIYVSFPKDGSPFTDDTKVAQGMLWWIRKIHGGSAYIYVTINARNISNTSVPPPAPTIDLKLSKQAKLLDTTENTITHSTPSKNTTDRIYFVWNPIAPFPTLDNFQTVISSQLFPPVLYAQQFARLVDFATGFGDPGVTFGVRFPDGSQYVGDGFFPDMASAEAYAGSWNNTFNQNPQPIIEQYILPEGGIVEAGFSNVFATFIEIPVASGAFAETILQKKYLIQIPVKENDTEFKMNISGTGINSGSSDIYVQGFSDQKKPLKKITDIDSADPGPDPDKAPDFGRSVKTGANTYTVTTEVVAGPDPAAKAHRVDIKITGGSHGDRG